MDNINYVCPIHGKINSGSKKMIVYRPSGSLTKNLCLDCCFDYLASVLPPLKKMTDEEFESINDTMRVTSKIAEDYFKD